jgi:ABC-type proline/glycine betaine transport systems, ATPase components
MSIIKFEHARKAYGKNVIIPDFNLDIEKGEFVSVIGTSGCGKTTLLKMMNGLIALDRGTIYINGKDIRKENQIELRRNIGYAIQGSGLFPHMSVYENIAYVPNLINRKDKQKTKAAVEKWVQVVGLDQAILERYPDELSGGQQQRVGIARALGASPDIVLMDEPFGAVDEITRHQLQKEIKQIHQETNVTIVFVTHDIQEALTLGTKVLVLEKGELAQYASAKMLQSNPANAYVERLVRGSL